MDKMMKIKKICDNGRITTLGFDVGCALQDSNVKTIADKKAVVQKFVGFQSDNIPSSTLKAIEQRMSAAVHLNLTVADVINIAHGRKPDVILNREIAVVTAQRNPQNTMV